MRVCVCVCVVVEWMVDGCINSGDICTPTESGSGVVYDKPSYKIFVTISGISRTNASCRCRLCVLCER